MPVSYSLTFLFRDFSNCNLADNDLPDLEACFDNTGRGIITGMYGILFFEDGQVNGHHIDLRLLCGTQCQPNLLGKQYVKIVPKRET